MSIGIRGKLTLMTLLLVTGVIVASSAIVTGIMDRFLLGELIKRGLSLSRGAANAAAFSMLAHDRLSLDNLVAKIKEGQEDISFVAVIDLKQLATAHSDLARTGRPLAAARICSVLSRDKDGSIVAKAARDGIILYEFSTPIRFARKNVGHLVLGIDPAALTEAQTSARRKVATVSAIILLLAMLGAFAVARLFTAPIRQLSCGLALLKEGKYRVAIPVKQRDELGDLTQDFNDMAQVILRQREKLEESYLATVKILATSIDARDDYTLQHSTRVASYSVLAGARMGLSDDELRDLEVAALVHDLGKIRIPDQILKKAGPLDAGEFALIREHARHGAEILGHSMALCRFIPAVLHHHEWYDGSGYPAGLKGEEIPLFASIIAIADTYDAMTSSRPYRHGLPMQTALEEIGRQRGSQFNPGIAALFIAVMEKAALESPQLNLEVSHEKPVQSSLLAVAGGGTAVMLQSGTELAPPGTYRRGLVSGTG